MVFLLDKFDSFERVYKVLTPGRFYLHGYYLFVLTRGIFEEHEMGNLTLSVWKKGISNFNIIYAKDGVVNFTMIRPYSSKSCSDTTLISVNLLKDKKFLSDTKMILFPKDKFDNLHRCPIRVVTFQRCPSMCYNRTTSRFSGYDYEVIQALEEILNFQINMTFLLGSEQWGTILPNGTTTGGLNVLRNGRADVAIGNYMLRLSRLQYFDSTVSYYSIPIVLVIPPPEKYTPIEKLLRPFGKNIWMLLGLVFSIGLFTIIFINCKLKHLKSFVYGRNVKSPTMNFISVIFGIQQTVVPTRNFARFILMMFLLFCLINRNAYQGALYIILRSDGTRKEVQSVSEMVEKDFKFYMFSSYVDVVDETTRIYQRRIVIQSEKELPFSREVDETLKSAFMTPLTDVINRNERARGKFSLRVCKEQVSIMSIVMLMKKGFHLMDTFNELLLRFDSVGFSSHWFETYAQQRYLNIKVRGIGPRKMNFDDLFGVFNVLLAGYGIAILIFVFEHIVTMVKKANNAKKQVTMQSSKIGNAPKKIK
ncbi:unnamed protein product [Chironomus riparius]|uniref:Ionotropic receptor n=1 Tax=Chironomus riparius TaxID=315576 RepID=A0A9P0NF84_9DIPT|nr:unnamed protein product [Chironomus riparius]